MKNYLDWSWQVLDLLFIVALAAAMFLGGKVAPPFGYCRSVSHSVFASCDEKPTIYNLHLETAGALRALFHL